MIYRVVSTSPCTPFLSGRKISVNAGECLALTQEQYDSLIISGPFRTKFYLVTIDEEATDGNVEVVEPKKEVSELGELEVPVFGRSVPSVDDTLEELGNEANSSLNNLVTPLVSSSESLVADEASIDASSLPLVQDIQESADQANEQLSNLLKPKTSRKK